MKICRFLFGCLISLCTGIRASEHCSPSDNESVLQTNTVYTYLFRSVALSQAVGTTEDHGKFVLECKAHISHDRQCYYNLELKDCSMTASGGEPGFESPWMDQKPLPELTRYHVVFSLVNGEIKEVKTHPDDPLYYVNIKKGVLSAFVFKLSQTTKELDEMHVDIHGTCPLKSEPGKEAGDVKTTKDMPHCQFPSRPDWQFSPWSMFWNMSFIQHVINSTTDCNYLVNTAGKRIDMMTCHERHAIMLESTHRTTTAVQTNILYEMAFLTSEVQNSKPTYDELTRKTDIRYEYEDTLEPQTSPQDFLKIAVKMLSDLVLDSVDEIRLFTIPQFTNFVAWVRASHDLTDLVNKVKFCEFLPSEKSCDDSIKELAMSYLSDALVQCNTVPCAKAIAYLAKNDDLSPTYLSFVFNSWSYMHYSKPGFLTNFKDMCTFKESHQCWISLGAFARRTYSRENLLESKVLQEVKDVATSFHSHIEEECEVTSDANNAQYTKCLVFMKAASNLGKFYTKLVPDGVSRILEHATNDHSPIFVRTSALEAIKEVFDSENKEQRREIYDELLSLLKNYSLPASVRILSYDQLILVMSEEYHLEEELIGLLKEEKNPEVKFYIADSLNSLIADRQFRAKQEKFLHSLTELLEENHLSLELILYRSKGKSKTSSNSVFFNFAFLPDSIRKFGLKATESRLFDAIMYPTVLNQETIMQLFSTFIPSSKLGSYFEGWEEVLLTLKKNLADMDSKTTSFPNLFEAVVKTLEGYGSKEEDESASHFEGNLIDNLKKIHRLYWQHHKKLNPYAKAYLDLFGSTVKYMVHDDIQKSTVNQDMSRLMRFLRKDLEDGVTYNATRVIRVIEAYHQVPTMMGLPLNWTTNATLAFTIRAGLKYQLNAANNQMHSKGFFQPSAALTFLNRMVLDFPTVTQIGVQANSSGYTSTDFRLQYDSSKGKQTLRIERPSKTQKILELFRTNQLIKHNNYVDIPDWDIQRTSSSWCTKGDTNSFAGLQFCLSKSYPNVTHRIKPWALMAGWCKWRFLVHPVDQNNVHYDFQLQETPKQKSKEYTAKISVTEKEKEKAAHFRVVIDESGKDMKMELRTSLLPDFVASLTQAEIIRNKKVLGQKVETILKLGKDFKYELEYTSEAKKQKPQISSIKGGTSPDEDNQIMLYEEKISLITPYAAYKGNKTILKAGENIKATASLQYENLNTKSNWLKMFLPPGYWENDKKASINILLHWKKPIHMSEHTVTRQTEFRLSVPHYTIILHADSLDMKKRNQINVHLAKRNLKYKKLETFLNFTYDWWRNENEGNPMISIGQVNITVPRRSWSVKYQSGVELQAPSNDVKYSWEVVLKRILMKTEQEDLKNYVGWWSEEVDDHFALEEKKVKLNVDVKLLSLDNKEQIDKYFWALEGEDSEYFASSAITAKVALQYPLSDRAESVVLDGYLLTSRGMEIYRMQNTFNLTSSYNNLRLTADSVYKSESYHSDSLYHKSYFTHLPSQTKAFNTIRYTRENPTDQCKQITFTHDMRSHVFDLSTDASYKCQQEDNNLYTLLLKINTNSSKWDMLNMTLDQVIQDISPDYKREDVVVHHPLGTINVDAEWHGKRQKDHHKRVVVCSKKGNCPNAEFTYESFHYGKTNMKLSLPNQNDSQITYERDISSDYNNLHIKLGHSNKESKFTEFFDFTGEIVNENYQVFKGMVDMKTFAKVKALILPAYNSTCDAVSTVAKNASHPLNEILRPALKMTLYDWWKSVKTEVREFWSLSWQEIKETFLTLEAFTESAYTILCNSITGINELFRIAYNAIKERSITIWAIHYFELPYYFKQAYLNIPQGICELMQQLTLQEESVLNFKFIIGKIFSIRAFNEWPSFNFYPPWLQRFFDDDTKIEVSSTNQLEKGEKLAMIFGPLHVYTFDGLLYDVLQYPHQDCTYMLAHDVHKSLFTVFSSEKGIHLLFPEMSLSVDDHNEVFINGSKRPALLPTQAANGKVTVKRGLDIVEVWSPSLSVICSSRHFLCLLKLRDFHSGGVIGLLGNADDDLDNEFMLPNGNTTSNLSEYMKSYEISGKPECKNLVQTTVPSASAEEQSICSREFGSACNNRYLLHLHFLEACVSDIKAGHSPCYAASGLSAVCNLKYAPTQTTCSEIKQESVNIRRNLEVVLVVQESKHLTSPDSANAPLKGIENLVREIDAKFKENSYNSVKFSLVGYGGSGVHYAPAVHSAGKDIWLPADDMIRDVLKTLEFKSKKDADAVVALKYALDELGYDSFDSKVVVVIAAKDRQVAEKSLTDSIKRHLEENGITLYTLSSYPSVEKGKKVYGVRADGLIFPFHTKNDEAYLDYPRGNLAKLTSSTRGSLFLSKFLVDNKPASFFTEVAQEVWAKINKEVEKCRSCKSVASGWWWYKNQCAIVHC